MSEFELYETEMICDARRPIVPNRRVGVDVIRKTLLFLVPHFFKIQFQICIPSAASYEHRYTQSA